MRFSLNDKKTRIQILVLLILILGAGYYFWYYQPLVTTLNQTEQKYNKLEMEILFGRKRAVELREYAQLVADLKDQVAEVENRLLGGNRILLFLQALEESSRKSGVELITLEPLSINDSEDIIQQPVRVSSVGSLERTRIFINMIEDLAYPSEIEKASFHFVEGTGTDQLQTELVIVMYSLKGGEV